VGGWAGGLGEEGCAGRLELWDYEQEVTRAFSKPYTQGGRHTFVKTPGGRVELCDECGSEPQRFEKMRKTREKSSGEGKSVHEGPLTDYTQKGGGLSCYPLTQ
jgi:hypothetical protein